MLMASIKSDTEERILFQCSAQNWPRPIQVQWSGERMMDIHERINNTLLHAWK